jgi:hypothetical protein
MMLLSGCAGMVISGSAVCQLEPQLPTVSEEDTDQTILEIDNFNSKFRSACDLRSSRAESIFKKN